MSIVTIDGKISPEALGRTYIHEHLRIDLSAQKKDEDANFNDTENIISELLDLKHKGVDAIVEVTNIGMGRDVSTIKKIAEATKIKVIASTGFYKEPFLPDFVYNLNEDEIMQIMLGDITEGIDGTDIKAHVIGEIGTSNCCITQIEEKMLKIAAKVHSETGNPVFTHTTLGTMALEQLEILKENGASLNKVVIGHVDLNCDLDYHLRIADTGCYLAFDTIGKNNYQPDEKRVENIVELVKRGHIDQLLLSQDITRKSHLKAFGGIGYSYLMDEFIPMLIEAGLSHNQIDHIMTANSRRLLNI